MIYKYAMLKANLSNTVQKRTYIPVARLKQKSDHAICDNWNFVNDEKLQIAASPRNKFWSSLVVPQLPNEKKTKQKQAGKSMCVHSCCFLFSSVLKDSGRLWDILWNFDSSIVPSSCSARSCIAANLLPFTTSNSCRKRSTPPNSFSFRVILSRCFCERSSSLIALFPT